MLAPSLPPGWMLAPQAALSIYFFIYISIYFILISYPMIRILSGRNPYFQRQFALPPVQQPAHLPPAFAAETMAADQRDPNPPRSAPCIEHPCLEKVASWKRGWGRGWRGKTGANPTAPVLVPSWSNSAMQVLQVPRAPGPKVAWSVKALAHGFKGWNPAKEFGP